MARAKSGISNSDNFGLELEWKYNIIIELFNIACDVALTWSPRIVSRERIWRTKSDFSI